jgi:hypothetical protein
MRRLRVIAVGVLAVAVFASGPAAITSATAAGERAAVPNPRGSYLSGKFDQRVVDRVVADLARVGIGVYELGTSAPLHRVHAPESPVRLTLEQARNAALGAWAHSGLSGADLDMLAPLDPGLETTVPPASAILAAYVKAAKTPGAELARRIMGGQDWKRFQSIVFPAVVLELFESDLAEKALGGKAAPDASAMQASATPTGVVSHLGKGVARAGACSLVLDFIDRTIKAVFAAIPRIRAPDAAKVTGIFGGFLGGIINTAVHLAVGAVNGLIDGIQTLVVNGVKVLVQPVLDVIADVAAVVATVATVVTTLQPWSGRIKASPSPTRKAVGSERPIPGAFTLTVQTVGVTPDEWPQDIADCANRAGVTLPPLRPQDAPVTWDVQDQSPATLATPTSSGTTMLAKDSTAKLEFATTVESAEVVKNGTLQYGAVRAVATVKRDDLEKLRDQLVNLLFRQIPAVVAPIIGPPLRALLTPKINAALSGITSLQDVKAEGFEYVKYHEPKLEEKTPPPTAGPESPSNRGFCPVLKRAIIAQARLLQAFADDPFGSNLDSILDEIQAINRELLAAAPAKLRRTVSTFVAGAEALVAAVHARQPDPAKAMRTPAVQAASRKLSDYATSVCKISATSSGG